MVRLAEAEIGARGACSWRSLYRSTHGLTVAPPTSSRHRRSSACSGATGLGMMFESMRRSHSALTAPALENCVTCDGMTASAALSTHHAACCLTECDEVSLPIRRTRTGMSPESMIAEACASVPARMFETIQHTQLTVGMSLESSNGRSAWMAPRSMTTCARWRW